MATCPTYKKPYPTEDMAVDALIEARIRFEHNSAMAVYQCEDCGDWHLTSRGPMHPRLHEVLNDGTIKKEREAFLWQTKFRR